MEKIFSPHLNLAQGYWKKHLHSGDWAIDATCGNGHDTLFLTSYCHVIALDIQPVAIQNTENLLAQHQKKALLYQWSHEQIDQLPLPQAPRLIVYNLGYLPKGDKTITTLTASTIASVKKSLHLITTDGAISITCYPGHDEGEREEQALVEFVSQLPSQKWSVCQHKWLNRPRSPTLIWISQIPSHL